MCKTSAVSGNECWPPVNNACTETWNPPCPLFFFLRFRVHSSALFAVPVLGSDLFFAHLANLRCITGTFALKPETIHSPVETQSREKNNEKKSEGAAGFAAHTCVILIRVIPVPTRTHGATGVGVTSHIRREAAAAVAVEGAEVRQHAGFQRRRNDLRSGPASSSRAWVGHKHTPARQPSAYSLLLSSLCSGRQALA